MSSRKNPNSLYPQIDVSNPEAVSSKPSSSSSSSSLYPSLDMKALTDTLFPEKDAASENPSFRQEREQPYEEVLVRIPGALVHLIERDHSVELASGELHMVSLKQGETIFAVFARVGDEIQWPLARDEASVKLDQCHYFFTLRLPETGKNDEEAEVLNYGLTFASKGQEHLLEEFDEILERYSAFSVQEVQGSANWEAIDGNVAREMSPEELKEAKENEEMMKRSSAAYWTVLAPNVEDYGGSVAKMIAAGSGQLIRGILWCGYVAVDRLRWGNDVLKKRLEKGYNKDISPATMRRIKRVKRLTKMSEKVALGVLSGVVKVSGFFTSSIVNSTVGKKFFSLLPGEIVLATLDGFNKVCDAVEVAGRNVMSTSSVVTTGLVSQRYGEQAAKATNESFGAAGHAIGTAWAVFKIRKALNPKSVIKPTTLVKAAAKANSTELKEKYKK